MTVTQFAGHTTFLSRHCMNGIQVLVCCISEGCVFFASYIFLGSDCTNLWMNTPVRNNVMAVKPKQSLYEYV